MNGRYDWYVGVDIGAEQASVVYGPDKDKLSQAFSIAQSQAGLTTLDERLVKAGAERERTLVVMEATGTYWMKLATALHGLGYGVSVINPKQAHHFAQALLKRSKTDAIDAHTLAVLAATLQPQAWKAPPAIYEELLQRLSERDALLDMRQQERNRLHALAQRPRVVKAVQRRMQAHLKFLDEQIASIEAELWATLKTDAAWEAAAKLLRSITGIGLISCAWLLTATLNFSACSRPEQLAAYAGLVPRARQSGSSLHAPPCIGHGGHAALRSALYMASLSAARHNPVIRDFYQGLLARGKPKKVAHVAAARKLVHLAWAVVTKQRPFQLPFPSTST
jgi:transposase